MTTDDWRKQMNKAMLIEASMHPELELLLYDGNNDIEKQIANKIINEAKENRVESLCSLSIEEIMPIINSSKLYIGNDTGFMHLSAGLNIPAIGLFGDTPLSYANYTKNILPLIGKLFSKDNSAYSYLSESASVFPYGEALNNILRKVGFIDVAAMPQTFGVATIYSASKK